MIKSPTEVAKIINAANIADRAFDRVVEIAAQGVPLDAVFRNFQRLCLEEGADWVPYLAGAAGAGGYHDVISPATETALRPGDVLMLDTGLVWDGYFCDFDRNYSLGPPSSDVAAAHARLIDATRAGLDTAKPGATMAHLFAAMAAVLNPCDSDAIRGRLGHGLGMNLTEGASIIPQDHTTLVAGMVLTLEPVIGLPGGRIMVHEENILVTPTGAQPLSRLQGPDIRVI